MNQNIKKRSKDASLQIDFFLLKTKNSIKTSHCPIKNRLDVYVFEMYWRIQLSSPRARLVQIVFLAINVSLKFQILKSNLLQLSNYQRKRYNFFNVNFDLFPFKNGAFLKKKLGQKSNLKFVKIPLLEWF